MVKKEKDELSFSHFAKMFSPLWKKKKSGEEDVEDINQEEDKDNNQEDDENMNKEEDGETNQEEDREKKKGDSIDQSEGPSEESKFDYVMSCKRPGLGGDHELCRLGNSRKLLLYLKLEQTFSWGTTFDAEKELSSST